MMIKKWMYLFSLVSLIGLANVAVADDAEPQHTTVYGKVTTLPECLEALQQCCAKICSGEGKQATKETLERMRRNREARERRLREIESRIAALENAPPGTNGSGDLAALRAELVKLIEETDAENDAEIAALREELTQFGDSLDGLEDDLTALGERVDGLEERIAALEASDDWFQFGIHLAGFGAVTTGGTSYSGVSIVNQLTFRVDPTWDVIVEGNPLIAPGDRPFGAQIRGAFGVRVTHTVRMELGYSGAGMAYSGNDKLEAKFRVLAGDLGLRYRNDNGFTFLATGGIGHGRGYGESNVAFWGRLGLGYSK